MALKDDLEASFNNIKSGKEQGRIEEVNSKTASYKR
jgi:hypothetical protein